MAAPGYSTGAYLAAKRELRGAPCWVCGRPADSVDHYPPLSAFPPGRWVGVLRPACLGCQHRQGGRLRRDQSRGRSVPLPSRAW